MLDHNRAATLDELIDTLMELYVSSPKEGTDRFEFARLRAMYVLDSWGLIGE